MSELPDPNFPRVEEETIFNRKKVKKYKKGRTHNDHDDDTNQGTDTSDKQDDPQTINSNDVNSTESSQSKSDTVESELPNSKVTVESKDQEVKVELEEKDPKGVPPAEEKQGEADGDDDDDNITIKFDDDDNEAAVSNEDTTSSPSPESGSLRHKIEPRSPTGVIVSPPKEEPRVEASQSEQVMDSHCESLGESASAFQKISCYNEEHPAFLISGILTCAIFLSCVIISRRRRNASNVSQSRSARSSNLWYRRGRWNPLSSNNDQGEYAALAVYDEILNDFNEEDLSSYGYSHADESDDDSIGTIISQWSNGVGPGEGIESGLSGKRIEMIPFDDGHLTLKEVNG